MQKIDPRAASALETKLAVGVASKFPVAFFVVASVFGPPDGLKDIINDGLNKRLMGCCGSIYY